MKKGGLVYSTNSNLELNPSIENSVFNKDEFIISVCFEKKGRKGKGVTIIKNFKGNKLELALLSKKIKTTLAVGGSIKDNDIILQGRIQEKVIQTLNADGYKTKKVGG